jgi:hypothetical protein
LSRAIPLGRRDQPISCDALFASVANVAFTLLMRSGWSHTGNIGVVAGARRVMTTNKKGGLIVIPSEAPKAALRSE